MTVPTEEGPANYVSAAAVIHRVQALSGFTGRKEHVGGILSQILKAEAQPWFGFDTGMLEIGRGKRN